MLCSLPRTYLNTSKIPFEFRVPVMCICLIMVVWGQGALVSFWLIKHRNRHRGQLISAWAVSAQPALYCKTLHFQANIISAVFAGDLFQWKWSLLKYVISLKIVRRLAKLTELKSQWMATKNKSTKLKSNHNYTFDQELTVWKCNIPHNSELCMKTSIT